MAASSSSTAPPPTRTEQAAPEKRPRGRSKATASTAAAVTGDTLPIAETPKKPRRGRQPKEEATASAASNEAAAKAAAKAATKPHRKPASGSAGSASAEASDRASSSATAKSRKRAAPKQEASGDNTLPVRESKPERESKPVRESKRPRSNKTSSGEEKRKKTTGWSRAAQNSATTSSDEVKEKKSSARSSGSGSESDDGLLQPTAARDLPGMDETWQREIMIANVTIKLFRGHPKRWYVICDDALKRLCPKLPDEMVVLVPGVVREEVWRAERVKVKKRKWLFCLNAESLQEQLRNAKLREDFEEKFGKLKAQRYPPLEAGRLKDVRDEEAAKERLPIADRGEASVTDIGDEPSVKKEDNRCYPCILADVPCEGRETGERLQICNFCRSCELSRRQCVLPPAAPPAAATATLPKCHYCRVPIGKGQLRRECGGCGLVVCSRAGCHRGVRVVERLPVFLCCHCLGVPQECGCSGSQTLLRRLILRAEVQARLPKELKHEGPVLEPFQPKTETPVRPEVSWLVRSASKRRWLELEHRHLILELRRLRINVKMLQDEDNADIMMEQWFSALLWPTDVVVKHLVALVGGPPRTVILDERLGWPRSSLPTRAAVPTVRRVRAKAKGKAKAKGRPFRPKTTGGKRKRRRASSTTSSGSSSSSSSSDSAKSSKSSRSSKSSKSSASAKTAKTAKSNKSAKSSKSSSTTCGYVKRFLEISATEEEDERAPGQT